jgi:ferredoxin
MKWMPPINIQISDRCISCGACVQVCPMGVLLYENPSRSKKPTITDASVCICCGQCVAVCPQDAITNNHLELDDFPKIDAAPSVEWNQFITLTRQRRSIRNFSHNKPVPRELIEKTSMNQHAMHLRVRYKLSDGFRVRPRSSGDESPGYGTAPDESRLFAPHKLKSLRRCSLARRSHRPRWARAPGRSTPYAGSHRF